MEDLYTPLGTSGLSSNLTGFFLVFFFHCFYFYIIFFLGRFFFFGFWFLRCVLWVSFRTVQAKANSAIMGFTFSGRKRRWDGAYIAAKKLPLFWILCLYQKRMLRNWGRCV
ncbi:hypothetical protein QBC42DRAFT_208772 [Cladorrhinum samala]|uniref:Transmembrane protein n=1 Tax=Cladorrhinum samala TaxID=585594 RepID=A0AAV9HHI4_9PEZI|nr:hypothetical protein QBC42DRAFT_208772 [Cladorrhinum samala]